MNGNNPYAGTPGTTQAGKRASADLAELSASQRRILRENVTRIAARTRSFLPDEYVVDSDVSQASGGARATVAVQPPVGHPVSAGFTPDGDDFEDEQLITDDDEFEVARGLAASAALQVKQTVQDDVTPTAR
ncbi:DUF5811 family protein [Natranaeroarchaeum aerophilus]|uniref:DUF5811 family protein n=1 Tax=Natranaeroarchaeum aerophilus TaxID=2917711 RepID=A0AAE3FRT1_9EURY|nr:DUF5811 family protein [Natranaeroarchaeum aerophilus]MCL9814427.1 DUF5811 family protein [Natranaeroarchaeum aerophilus]